MRPQSTQDKIKELLTILDSTADHSLSSVNNGKRFSRFRDRHGKLEFTQEYLDKLQKDEESYDQKKGRRYGQLASMIQLVDRMLVLREAVQDPKTKSGEILRAVGSLRTALGNLNLREPIVDLTNFQTSFSREVGKESGVMMLVETDDLVRMLKTGAKPYSTCMRWTEKTGPNYGLPAWPADANVKQYLLTPLEYMFDLGGEADLKKISASFRRMGLETQDNIVEVEVVGEQQKWKLRTSEGKTWILKHNETKETLEAYESKEGKDILRATLIAKKEKTRTAVYGPSENIYGRTIFECLDTNKGPRIHLKEVHPPNPAYTRVFREEADSKEEEMKIEKKKEEGKLVIKYPESRNKLSLSVGS